jgi:O-antigen/teichoic acid export membrane protein
MLSSVTAITFATGLGIAAVASDFVHVVLGAKWVGAIPLMPWLGLFAAVYGVVRTLDMFLIATGSERASSLLALGFVIFLVPVLWYSGQQGSVVGIAATKAGTAFGLVLLLGFVVTRLTAVTPGLLWAAVWPPMLASVVMFAGVKALQTELPLSHHMLGLLRDSLVGACLYASTSVMIWLARGRPPGIEQDLLAAIRRKLANH